MSQLFLSHSSKDNFAALALHDWLISEGWDALFLDLDLERSIVADKCRERLPQPEEQNRDLKFGRAHGL